MSTVLTTDESKYLLQLCKTGRLFAIQDWLEAGNPLCVAPEVKTTPLQVAIDAGFHSLVELLARNEPNQYVKNEALARAVFHRRLDFIELLVLHGAQIRAVPFDAVLLSWDPQIMQYFIERGADLITGAPFAHAFGEKIRTALRPWKECKQRYPELAKDLQEQIDCALRYFTCKGNLKWVSLLMWAGADPRTRGPVLYDKYQFEDWEFDDALCLATFRDVQIIKRLGPDRKRDNLEKLLADAARHGSPEVVEFLLKVGAIVNDESDGGSAALAESLGQGLRRITRWSSSSLNWDGTPKKASRYDLKEPLRTIEILFEKGARWRPKDKNAVTEVRRGLLECEPCVTTEIVERLIKSEACAAEVIIDLLRTPAMRRHLEPEARRFRPLGLDVRSDEQKREDERQQEATRIWNLRYLAARYDRAEIYDKIWSQPIQHVAKEYKVSDVYLIKVCKKLDIPRPGVGYWAKKAAGKSLPGRPTLRAFPELDEN